MSSVEFDTTVGGDGSTVSDDTNPVTGLDNDGHRFRFITALTNVVNIALWVKNRALEVLGYKNAALDAQEAAEQAADAAILALDQFDDRYLGSKSSDPALDNDGNALLEGALYWNSVAKQMRAYDGAAWVANYVPSALYLPKAGGVMSGPVDEAKGGNIASAATVDLEAATGNLVHITGTTTITAVLLNSGAARTVVFDGALTLTHHATNNNLPGAANIATAAGDRAVYRGDGSVARCISYTRADGSLLLAGPVNELKGADVASAATVNLTTATGNFVHITGTTGITAFTLPAGAERTVVFDGVLTITPGGSLLVPGGAAITTAAGDRATLRGDAGGVVNIVAFTRADGSALVGTPPVQFGTPGGAQVINSAAIGGNFTSVCVLSATAALVTYMDASSKPWVALVDGTGATLDKKTLDSSNTVTGGPDSVCQIKVSATSALVFWGSAGASDVRASLVSYSGSTLSVGALQTGLVGSGQGSAYLTGVMPSANRFWLMANQNSSNVVYAGVYTLSGATLTQVGSTTNLIAARVGALKAVMAAAGVGVVAKVDGSSATVDAFALSESAGTFTKGPLRYLARSTTINTLGVSLAAVPSTSGRVLAACTGGAEMQALAMTVDVSGSGASARLILGDACLLPATDGAAGSVRVTAVGTDSFALCRTDNVGTGTLLQPLLTKGQNVQKGLATNVVQSNPSDVGFMGTNLLVGTFGLTTGYPQTILVPQGNVQ